ncbi:MAG: AMP-dependent synthetase and ligase [Solirubrobacterales bacterium]|nr:AMP-dependent synthetase and ligase [Solirubrobacterales bacterium]
MTGPWSGPVPDAATVAAWRRHLAEGVDLERVVGELSTGSLAEAIHTTAMARSGEPALWLDGVELTHGGLDRCAATTAVRLAGHGIGVGDRVLLCGSSSAALVIAYLAILRLGAVVVLTNPGLTTPELRFLADDSNARTALGAGAVLERLAELTGAGSLRCVLDLDDVTAPAASTTVTRPPLPVPSDAPALLAYTSGTTGRPKAVPLSHGNLLSSIRAVMLAWRWTCDDVLVHALPLYHQHGLGGVHATLLAGSRAVIHSRLDPQLLCASVRDFSATVLFAVPAVYERLMAWDGIADAELGSLRLVTSGSAPLSPALGERVAARLGQLPLERYGSTESGLNISNPYDGPRRLGYVGLPLPGVEVAILGADGRRAPDGEDGEVVLRGPQLFGGYAEDTAATAAAFRPGGWFRTGDIGRVDPEDGYVAITGRAKELIITGGLNVSPREVELAIEDHPSVAKAAVVGLPSARWGEEVVGFAVAAPGATVEPEVVLAAARLRLAAYKCPKRLFVVPELPVNGLGKLVRSELVEYATALDGYGGALRRAVELLGTATDDPRA